MRRRRIVSAVLLAIICVPLYVSAYSSPGTAHGYVNDFAGVLSPATIQTLETELTTFEKTTSNEITVVTVTTLDGDYIENYAVKLFEEWGIGDKERDNGVLLLLAITEHKLRIEVGYGLEGALPDSVAQRILNTEMTPRLKAGQYDDAVTHAVTAIEQATQGEYVGDTSSGDQFLDMPVEGVLSSLFFVFFVLQFIASLLARSKSWWAGGILGVIGGSSVAWFVTQSVLTAALAAGVLGVIGSFIDFVVSRGYRNARARGVTPPWWTGGSGRSTGGGGGFGGFGGGSSGGGGASGGW